MRSVWFCLLAMLLASGSHAQEFSIHETEAAPPSADTYGVENTHYPLLSFAGSVPDSLTRTLRAVPPVIQPGTGREALISVLQMPVSSDASDRIPQEWFQSRLSTLTLLGAYEEAFQLAKSLPPSLMTEPLARRYTDLALLSGDPDAACKQTDQQMQKLENPDDAFWPSRALFCAYFRKDTAQVDLRLAIFSEQFASGHAVAQTLFAGWGVEKAPLPRLTAAEQDFTPVLTAALRHTPESRSVQHITAGFVQEGDARWLPAPLAAALATAEALPLATRYRLLESAMLRGVAEPSAIRELLVALDSTPGADNLPQDIRTAALLINDLKNTQGYDHKIRAMEHALFAFKQRYSPRIARALLSKELEEVGSLLYRYPLTPSLLLDLAADAIEKKDRERLRTVERYLEQHDDMPAMLMVLASVQEADALTRRIEGEPGENPAIPHLIPTPDAPSLWALRRLIAVKQALGHTVPPQALQMSAQAPASRSAPDSIALDELPNATSPGEMVLRAATLLGDGRSPYISDTTIARLVSALHQAGLEAYALALAREAILNPPTERTTP